DEPGQSLALLDDDAQKTRSLGDIELRIIVQNFRECSDRSQWRAQLVGDRGDEIVLEPVKLLEPLIRGAQLGAGALELARFLLELVAVGHDLRCLIQNMQNLLD